MKTNVKVIGYGLMVIGMLLVSMPTMAQDWQSTSSMQGSGSAYSSQVTAVGATDVNSMATTTESYTPANAPGRPRRAFDTGAETGQSDEFPIGDAVLPLLMMAMLFAGVVYFRRKRSI